MRQIIARLSGIKCKLQNFHSRISGLFHHPDHTVCQESKILCNNFHITQSLFYRPENIHSRSFFPMSEFRCQISVWNGIIFIESTEMINSDHIIKFYTMTDSLHPPCISGLLMIFPLIKRIAPKLSGCTKCIWRAPCNTSRKSVLIKLEQFRMRPTVCAVERYINRDITNDLNPFFIRICFQCTPLCCEFILHKLLEQDPFLILFGEFFQRKLISQTIFIFPFTPALPIIRGFDLRIKRIIIQPFFILLTEFLKICIICDPASFICFS